MRGLALLLPVLLTACGREPELTRPRLLVVISVDQMRPDTLTRFASEYRGGLGRLLREGRRFHGVLDHRATETAPGHSTLLTGMRPARTGIVANSWLSRPGLGRVYCVEDPKAPVYGAESHGRSPKNLLVETLGDWMKREDRYARVFSVSGKDRAAILMGGRHPDGAFWLDREAGGFTTSRYYMPEKLPRWLLAFRRDGWLRSLPGDWTYASSPALRADDDERESPKYGRASPHPLRRGDESKLIDRIYWSPFVDEWTLRLARRIVDEYGLGADGSTDLLCISLSATDTVGHLYGPFSQEIRDCTLRLDARLGEFFSYLDEHAAPYAVVLTADHGVLPIPEIKRIEARVTMQEIERAMKRRFDASGLYRVSGPEIWIDRRRAAKHGLSYGEVRDHLARLLRARPDVEAVFTAEELQSGRARGELARLSRASFHPDRSGDLVVILKPKMILDSYGTGTTHGSPWPYDREVPIVFMGPGIVAGDAGTTGRTIDIAPSLGRLLGLAVPADLDGGSLLE